MLQKLAKNYFKLLKEKVKALSFDLTECWLKIINKVALCGICCIWIFAEIDY